MASMWQALFGLCHQFITASVGTELNHCPWIHLPSTICMLHSRDWSQHHWASYMIYKVDNCYKINRPKRSKQTANWKRRNCDLHRSHSLLCSACVQTLCQGHEHAMWPACSSEANVKLLSMQHCFALRNCFPCGFSLNDSLSIIRRVGGMMSKGWGINKKLLSQAVSLDNPV